MNGTLYSSQSVLVLDYKFSKLTYLIKIPLIHAINSKLIFKYHWPLFNVAGASIANCWSDVDLLLKQRTINTVYQENNTKHNRTKSHHMTRSNIVWWLAMPSGQQSTPNNSFHWTPLHWPMNLSKTIFHLACTHACASPSSVNKLFFSKWHYQWLPNASLFVVIFCVLGCVFSRSFWVRLSIPVQLID